MSQEGPGREVETLRKQVEDLTEAPVRMEHHSSQMMKGEGAAARAPQGGLESPGEGSAPTFEGSRREVPGVDADPRAKSSAAGSPQEAFTLFGGNAPTFEGFRREVSGVEAAQQAATRAADLGLGVGEQVMQAGRAVARPPAPWPESVRSAARSREEEARPGVEGSSTAEGRNAGVREHGRSVEDTRTSLVEPVRAARGVTREFTLPPAAGSVADWGKHSSFHQYRTHSSKDIIENTLGKVALP